MASDVNGGLTVVGGAMVSASASNSHHKRPNPSPNSPATLSSSSSSSSSHHSSSDIQSTHESHHRGGSITITQADYDLLVNPTNAQLSQSLRLEYAKEKYPIRALFRYADR